MFTLLQIKRFQYNEHYAFLDRRDNCQKIVNDFVKCGGKDFEIPEQCRLQEMKLLLETERYLHNKGTGN